MSCASVKGASEPSIFPLLIDSSNVETMSISVGRREHREDEEENNGNERRTGENQGTHIDNFDVQFVYIYSSDAAAKRNCNRHTIHTGKAFLQLPRYALLP